MTKYDLSGNPIPERGGAAESNPSQDLSLPPRIVTPSSSPLAQPPAPRPAANAVPPPVAPPAAAPLPTGYSSAASSAPSHIAMIRESMAKKDGLEGLPLYVGLIVVTCLMFPITYAVAGLKPPALPPVTAFTPYSAGSVFTCDQPADWRVIGGAEDDEVGGHGGNAEVVFRTKKKAIIRIEASPLPVDPTTNQITATLDSVDQQNKKETKDFLGSELEAIEAEGDDPTPPSTYTETMAAVPPERAANLRISDWTLKVGPMKVPFHGLRAIVISRTEQVQVLCFCPERDYQNLKPAFQRVIQSITPSATP